MSNYNDVRSQIKDGDLIAVQGNHLIDKLTRLVTRSPYTHTGIALWLDDRLYMADLNSGRNHLTALSSVDNFDVYLPPFGLDPVMIRAAALDWLDVAIDYGMAAFIVIGLRCLIGSKAFIHWRKTIVCSGGSVEIYENAAANMAQAGFTPPQAWVEHTRMLSPGELAAELKLALSVRKAAA